MSEPTVAFTRVLCPTDFSECSTAAVDYAAALAAAFGVPLRLLHVITPFPIVAPLAALPTDSRVWETQEHVGRELLDAEAGRIRRPGGRVETELRTGPAVHEILAAAADWHADVIVLGTHGRGGFERLVLGSVAEKVLRKAGCAVVAVPPHGAGGAAGGVVTIAHVLCAHDGSAASDAGVAAAVALADRLGARLTLVTVVEELPGGTDFSGSAYDAYRAARDAHARETLDRALPPDVRVRCDVHERMPYGHPGRQILDVAAQEHPDLIVMGVQGRGAVDLALFGSTTSHVVRHAPCPVLTVRPATTGA
jgi:nucleotide-binding universal stress UspA family protein